MTGSDNNETKETLFSIITSSTIAGLLARSIMHPIDTIKARMQVQKTKHVRDESTIYKNSVDAVRKIYKFEGLRGFYRGLGVALAFTGPAQTLYLTSYDVAKQKYSKWFGVSDTNFGVHFLSGFTAEMFSCIIWVPHDVMKERLQVMRTNTSGFREVFEVVRKDGFRELYKGYWVTVGTFGPYSAVYFLCYEQFKNYIAKLRKIEKAQLDFKSYLFSAFLASGIAAAVTNPFDVIKVRFQVQRRTQGLPASELYNGFFDGWRKLVTHEGYKALWKGLTPRVLYSAPNLAIIMATYELLKKWINS